MFGGSDLRRAAFAAVLAVVATCSAPPDSARAQGILDGLACGNGLSIPGLTGGGEDGPLLSPGPSPQAPFVGFNEDVVAGIHGIAPVDYVELVRTIGGNTLRTNIDWRNAEPKRNCWDLEWWAHWRDLYNSAVSRGVRPIFIIGGAPAWARDQTPAERDCSGYGGCVFPPRREMDPEWTEFVAEVTRSFPQALIEVWNEPNLGSMWSSGPNPERWAELVVLASSAVESVSPETEVIAGGLLGIRSVKGPGLEMRMREFLARAYAATPTIEGNVDYLGVHPYTTRGRLGRKSAFKRAFHDMRAVRDANADPTPIFVTEFGISTNSPGVDEQRQAKLLARVHNRVMAAPGVAGIVYHRVIEPRDTTDDPQEIGYAWLRHGRTPPEPRPVFCHFAERARRSYVGC